MGVIARHAPRWRENEAGGVLVRDHDILLGRNQDGYLTLGGYEPVALHAPTGTGKTADWVIPNCFAWRGSLVVLDIKGEAFRATAGHRVAMGQDVYLFEPDSLTERSHRWDPFSGVQRGSLARFRQISRLSNLLFPEIDQIGSGANHNKFWEDAGRQATSSVTTILAETPHERLAMDRVGAIFNRADGHEWLASQIAGRRLTDNPYSQIAVDGISDYIGEDQKLRNDIRKTVSVRLQTWTDPQVAAVTAGSDFNLRNLRRKPMTVYVVVAPGNIPRLRPLLRLFFDQLINANTDVTPQQDPALTWPCLVMLDEFARLGRMDALAHAAQYARGYGLRMAYVIQDRAQLRSIYGHDGASDILSNVAAEIIFGVADQELAQDLENRLGDNTVMFTTRNRPRFWAWLNWSKQAESDHPHRRPLLLDQEVTRMSPDQQLILRRGMKPMRTQRCRWFTNRDFTSRVRRPPEIPKLDISIAYDNGETRIKARGDGAVAVPKAARHAPSRPALPARLLT
jgi:type IV secretion system protein VirD4